MSVSFADSNKVPTIWGRDTAVDFVGHRGISYYKEITAYMNYLTNLTEFSEDPELQEGTFMPLEVISDDGAEISFDFEDSNNGPAVYAGNDIYVIRIADYYDYTDSSYSDSVAKHMSITATKDGLSTTNRYTLNRVAPAST